MEYTDKDRKNIAVWLRKRELKKREREACDNNNQILQPFAPDYDIRSLHLRQRKTLVDIINEARPDIRENIRNLAALNIDVDTIERIVRYL